MSDIDFDFLYYIFCVKMGQREEVFFSSTFGKVVYLIDRWTEDEKSAADTINGHAPNASVPRTAKSFKDIIGGAIHG